MRGGSNGTHHTLILPEEIREPAIVLKDQYFDLKGLSAYSSLAISTLRDYIREGKLPCYKIKGKVLIKRSTFDAVIEEHRVKRGENLNGIVDGVLDDLKRAKSDHQSEGHRH